MKITLTCMEPEKRDLLDMVMEEWSKQWSQLPEKYRSPQDPRDVYQFAYWLIRWSGLVQPANTKAKGDE